MHKAYCEGYNCLRQEPIMNGLGILHVVQIDYLPCWQVGLSTV